VNGHDLPGVIALDDIDAFEGDWLAVAAFAFAGPLYGRGGEEPRTKHLSGR
jgi:hypothetical protein